MKIRFTEGVSGPDYLYQAGAEIDLPRADALKFIRHGCAVEVTKEVEPKQQPVKVGEVKAHTRPIKKRTV